MPMDPTIRFDQNPGDAFKDLGRYRRLIEKFIYLTITRPDITFVVGVLRAVYVDFSSTPSGCCLLCFMVSQGGTW